MFRRLLSTSAPASAVLVRLLVGSIFLSEGIQKFLYPAELGGRALCKNRYSRSGNHGTVRWWMRNFLRRPVDNWTANPAGSHGVAHRYQRRDCLNENSSPSRPWLLGPLALQTASLWVSGA